MLSHRPIRLLIYLFVLFCALAWFVGHAGEEMAKIQRQVYVNHDQWEDINANRKQ